MKTDLTAGLELDTLIAQRVLGQVVVPDAVNVRGVSVGRAGYHGADLPPYSTDRQAAMTLLDSWPGDWEIRRQNDHYKVTLYEPSM